ncbi:hypothetical protein GCK72_000023 [Caenorhabditis remanei]|uniref:C2H2-type domain-containing protein n=1 Tax=Caenorhabditis remanei TaxID=31234 RepID=A0A6A5HM39_CAERE|nr:hypothetical protein GCK72_000023 [Caenorhabditis remanei]KAF1768211.1 hypothetical protein GCK72_000023 [Caenorhabditis remanei]
MPTGDTNLKFNDGYILLKDLEVWYSKGFIASEDEIRFFKKDGKDASDVYTIASLIQQNGKEFPFRNQPISSPSNASDVQNPTGRINRTDVIYVRHRGPWIASDQGCPEPCSSAEMNNRNRTSSPSRHSQNIRPYTSPNYTLEPPPGIPRPTPLAQNKPLVARPGGFEGSKSTSISDINQTVGGYDIKPPPGLPIPFNPYGFGSSSAQNDPVASQLSQSNYPQATVGGQIRAFNIEPPPGLFLKRASDNQQFDSAQNFQDTEESESQSQNHLPEMPIPEVDNNTDMELPPGLLIPRPDDVIQVVQSESAVTETPTSDKKLPTASNSEENQTGNFDIETPPELFSSSEINQEQSFDSASVPTKGSLEDGSEESTPEMSALSAMSSPSNAPGRSHLLNSTGRLNRTDVIYVTDRGPWIASDQGLPDSIRSAEMKNRNSTSSPPRHSPNYHLYSPPNYTLEPNEPISEAEVDERLVESTPESNSEVDHNENFDVETPPGLFNSTATNQEQLLDSNPVPTTEQSESAQDEPIEESTPDTPALSVDQASHLKVGSSQNDPADKNSQNKESKPEDAHSQGSESTPMMPDKPEDSVNLEVDKPSESEPKSTVMPLILFNNITGNSDYIYHDCPLFNNKNEPEDDRITGPEIIEEMEKLMSHIDMDSWCKEYSTYFFFLSERVSKIGMRDRITICRFCRIAPNNGSDIVKHLFSENHIEHLSKHQISKTSFSFWSTHFEMCKRTTAHRKLRKDKIPLFESFEYSEKEKLEVSEVNEIVELFSRIKDVEFMNRQCFVAILFERRGAPKFCHTCRVPMPTLIYDYASHIFSKSHLTCLRGVSQADIDFWIEVLKFPIGETTDEITINKPIFDVIPLWMSRRNYDLRRLEPSEIDLLVSLVRNLSSTFGNSYLANFFDLMYLPDECIACKERLGPRILGPRSMCFIKHILSEKHLKTLTRIPEEHYNFWVNILNLEKSTKKVYSEDKIRVLTNRNTNPIPLFDFKLDSVLLPKEQRARKIDLLFKIYELIDEQVWSTDPLKYGNSGETIDSKEVTCFTCYARKEKFKTQQQLVSHLFSKRHVDYYLIPFGFSERAFLWWKRTLETLANIDSSQIELAMESSSAQSALPEEQETQDAELFREGSKSEDDITTDEEFRDNEEDEKKEIEPNDCRVPLLDKPLSDVEMVPQTSKNPLAQLSWVIRNKCTDEQQERGQKVLMSTCYCTFCDDALQPIGFGNKLFLFSHVASWNHWEKMNNTAPVEEIKYWEKWAYSIIEETLMSKEKFDETLDECKAILEESRSLRVLGRKDRVYWTCEYCNTVPKTVRLEEKVQVLYHIVSDEHREKMDHKATESDLEFWKKWATDLKEMWKINEEKKLAAYLKCYGETVQKPKNDPRVPLLDYPNRGENLHIRVYKLRYNGMRELLTLVEPNEETQEAMDCVCYHCPGTPRMTTKWEVMHHVFDGVHDLNIKYMGSSSDFLEYKKIMRTLLDAKPSLKSVPKLTLPTPPKRMTLPYKLEMCKLPLFAYNYFEAEGFVGTLSAGPTNIQIDFLTRMEVKNETQILKFFEKPTKCLLCPLDMSDYSIEEVVKHAFSPVHLNFFEKYASCFYVEEFDWWMDKLRNASHIEPPAEDSVPQQEYHLGGLKAIDMLKILPIFENFSDEQIELIANIDEDKVKEHKVVLQKKFGGCVYCDKWLLDPLEIIRHYLSEQHFKMVRVWHPVKNVDVEDILAYVKMCQKEKENQDQPAESSEES